MMTDELIYNPDKLLDKLCDKSPQCYRPPKQVALQAYANTPEWLRRLIVHEYQDFIVDGDDIVSPNVTTVDRQSGTFVSQSSPSTTLQGKRKTR